MSEGGGKSFARAVPRRSQPTPPKPPSPPKPLLLVFLLALLAARAPDDDLVLLDRHLHRTVAGPVLGVDGVVLHGGIEPQPVPLLAVVEGGLQGCGGGA